ncbi:MAG TPA: cobalamin-dependent protein [Polyangiaceae bacterium]|nr:cobalamin-dependent protein [Polyangiaceae bacterium]
MTTTELARVPRPLPANPRLLLAGVFGPFGVDDAFGRRDNVMELFHNQVTKAQGLASFRYHHRSFGLYFLAENVDADVTVLDFPSRRRFEREVARGQYDVIGISFIAPNFLKAREMARIVRRRSPRSIILLGGHGAAIEGIEREIDCDHVVRGEGIRWLRGFLGQDPDAPIRHPVLPSTERQTIFGIPVPGPTSGLLVPGVGCVNACKFCSTSHFFGKSYTPFLGTGAEVFAAACSVGDARGSDDFFVMDENFLKDRARAVELLRLQEQSGRFFNLQVFSSAEAVTALSVEQLVRLGIEFVWIGVESSSEEGNFEKNAGIDPRPLIRELRDHGVHVLASGILCQEHHTPTNLQREIDFLVGLEADFVQFMLLTPLPTTRLYREHEARGLLRRDLGYEDWHGQRHLAYRHPHFADGEPGAWLDRAFAEEYRVNSSSMYRVLETAWRGYQTLRAAGRDDPCWRARTEYRRRKVVAWSPMLDVIERFSVNELERVRVRALRAAIEAAVPETTTLYARARNAGALALARVASLRRRWFDDRIQPRTICTRYPAGRSAVTASSAPARFRLPVASVPDLPVAACAAD